MKKIFLILAVFSLILPSYSMDMKDFEKNLTVHKMDNGLTFLLYERHNAPVVSFHTYVDVGSVNETYGITGISHMLEHMAFKGTTVVGAKDLEKELATMKKIDDLFLKLYHLEDNKGSEENIEQVKAEISKLQEEAESYANIGEFDQVISRNGSPDLNAFTTSDATQYHYSLPSNKIELFMYLESERYVHPVFRQFYKERDVVTEERRMRTESNPIGKLLEQFQLMSFTYHPYHGTTIGAMSELQRYTREKILNYFKKYYNPKTMTIAIVGDFNTKEVISLADKYFSRIPAGEVPRPIDSVEPEQTVERKLVLKENSQPIYLVGYHRPSGASDDDATLSALAQILGQGRSSRLYKRLVKDDKIAAQVGAMNGFPGTKYPSLLMMYGVSNPGHSNDEIEKVIDEEIEKLQKEKVSIDELQKVKARAKASLVYGLKSNMGIAQSLATSQVLFGSWKEIFSGVEKIDKVTPEDIQNAAIKYLNKSGRNVGVIVPKEK